MKDPTRGNILAVDDTAASLRLLTEILTGENYEVRSAINGKLALRSAFAKAPDLILLDVSMSEMDGFEVCRRLKENPELANIPVIFVSALNEPSEKLKGFAMGGVDYVTKPFQREELLARVRTHLDLYRLRSQLEEMVQERTVSLQENERKLRRSLLESVSAVAAMVEMRDPYTAGHQRRVAHLATEIARKINLSEHQIEGIYLASVVHDVGKMGIPAEILSKPGNLSDLEFNLIKAHPQTGYDILKSIDFPWPIARIVLQHQERYNGSGYPNGLKNNEILPEARIIIVADVVEAMSSHRPYRPAKGIPAALEEIQKNRKILYDPAIVDVCLELFKNNEFDFE